MKRKNNFNQIQKILSYDTITQKGDFEILLQADLKKLLGDYFNIKDNIIVSIRKTNSELDVQISFTAFSQKVFCSLPKGT